MIQIGLFVFSVLLRNDFIHFFYDFLILFLRQDILQFSRVFGCTETKSKFIGWDIDHILILLLQTNHLLPHDLLHVGSDKDIHSAVVSLPAVLFSLEKRLSSTNMTEIGDVFFLYF